MEKWFRLIGRLEGISFLLLLFLAMPLKYYGGMPQGVKVLGPIHGFLFLAYCLWAYLCAQEQEWALGKHLLAYAAAILPFGTFFFETKYLPKRASL